MKMAIDFSSLDAIPLNQRNEYYRTIFDKVDVTKDGRISVHELQSMIQNHRDDFTIGIDGDLSVKILQISDVNCDRFLDFDEFVKMLTNPQFQPIFGRYLSIYLDFIGGIQRSNTKSICTTFVTSAMIYISIVQVIAFMIDDKILSNEQLTSILIYDHRLRLECWRFMTYMFVHVGYGHLIGNLLIQIMIGIPLEIINGSARVLVIYISGVLASSLATSMTEDPRILLAGASGGVYALITAHIASIIMNWSETALWKLIWLLLVTVFSVSNIAISICNRYRSLGGEGNTSYVAHIAGAFAGFFVGINVVRNFRETKPEKYLWWISIVLIGSFFVSAVLVNIFQ